MPSIDKEDILSGLGPIIEDVHLVLLDQHCIDVRWIPRETNKVAYNLVHHAKTANPFKSLWNFPLNYIKQFVLDNFQQSH